MAKHRNVQTMPHDSTGTLKFSDAKDIGEIQIGSPSGGAKCRWVS